MIATLQKSNPAINNERRKSETRDKIRVMQHYADGGKIESLRLDRADEEWVPCAAPVFNWQKFEYRITL